MRKKELEEALDEAQAAKADLKRAYHAEKEARARAEADAIRYKQLAEDGYADIPLLERLLQCEQELVPTPSDPAAFSDVKRALNYLRLELKR